MISVYKIKPAFQKLLQPLLTGLNKIRVTANQLTIFAIIFSAIMGYGFLHYQKYPIVLLLIPLGLLFRMALNALDGMMATQFNMKSKLGEILNELGDVISDLFIIFPFVIVEEINPIVIILFAVLSIINEFSGILGKVICGERRYEGPMGKSDRALILGLFCLTFYFWRDVALYGNWIFGIASVLIVLSTVTRLRNSLKLNDNI